MLKCHNSQNIFRNEGDEGARESEVTSTDSPFMCRQGHQLHRLRRRVQILERRFPISIQHGIRQQWGISREELFSDLQVVPHHDFSGKLPDWTG